MKCTWVIAFCVCLSATAFAQDRKTLEDCIGLALQHHPSLRAGAARAQAASARIREAAAAYLPQIDATYAANRRSTSIAARTGTTLGTATQTFNFFNTGVSFSQLLFDFGQGLYMIESAQAQAEASAADLETLREQVKLGVKQAYFGLLTAQHLQQVAFEAVRRSEKHLELAKTRYELGLAPRMDVTREQAQLAANRLDLLRAEHNVRIGYETLRNALGLDAPVDFALQDVPYLPRTLPDEQLLVQFAWDNRPEMRSLAAQIRATEKNALALERNHLPLVTGGAQYQWSGATFPLEPNWNIGATVTVPLFRGGLTVAQVEAAKQNVLALQYDENTLRQSVALEVREALVRFHEAIKSIEVSRQGTEQARENLQLAEGRYETGVGSIIEVTDAQSTFVGARGQEIQALYGYHLAVAALEKAIGAALDDLHLASREVE